LFILSIGNSNDNTNGTNSNETILKNKNVLLSGAGVRNGFEGSHIFDRLFIYIDNLLKNHQHIQRGLQLLIILIIFYLFKLLY
jgi:hypothetical protein